MSRLPTSRLFREYILHYLYKFLVTIWPRSWKNLQLRQPRKLWLPPEIVDTIARHLRDDRRSLKNLRLLSRAFAAGGLYQLITNAQFWMISCDDDEMAAFQGLSESPVAPYIRHLSVSDRTIIGVRQFRPRYEFLIQSDESGDESAADRLKRRMRKRWQSDSPGQVYTDLEMAEYGYEPTWDLIGGDTLRTYRQRVDQLCQILKQFPRLQSIDTDASLYSKLVLNDEDGLQSSYKFVWGSQGWPRPQSNDDEYCYNTPPESLDDCPHYMNLKYNGFVPLAWQLGRLARGTDLLDIPFTTTLTFLRLHFHSPAEDYENDQNVFEERAGLTRLINACTNLRKLCFVSTLCSRMEVVSGDDVAKIITQIKLPRLQEVMLTGGATPPDSIRGFVDNHASTLRKLSLDSISMLSDFLGWSAMLSSVAELEYLEDLCYRFADNETRSMDVSDVPRMPSHWCWSWFREGEKSLGDHICELISSLEQRRPQLLDPWTDEYANNYAKWDMSTLTQRTDARAKLKARPYTGKAIESILDNWYQISWNARYWP